MVKITIDGKEVEATPGRLLIDVLMENGKEIPHYCYHEKLSIAGSCRLCMVEVEGAPKPMISCNTTVRPDMIINTQTDIIKKGREDVLEFLLLNHPLDCPVCDKAGECKLQDYTFKYGKDTSRYEEPKRVPPFKDLGPDIMIATTRCVMCTRCVRFMREIAGDGQLTVRNRGYQNEICTAGDVKLDHPLAGNVVDICPVGALQNKNYIHRTRVWHLTKTPSICGECSTGCNISAETYNNETFRLVPRKNDDVNQDWMCDKGRESYSTYSSLERLNSATVKVEGKVRPLLNKDVFNFLAEGFTKYINHHEAAVVVASSATTEEMFAASEFSKKVMKSDLVAPIYKEAGEDQVFNGGFTIKGDTYPNNEGFKLVFKNENLEDLYKQLIASIESHRIKAVYLVKNDLNDLPAALMTALKTLKFLAVETITASGLTELADVVIPGKYNFEKTGTFINTNGRIQLTQKSIEGPDNSLDTWQSFKSIAQRLKQKFEWNSSNDIFLQMEKVYADVSGLSHFKLGPLGKQIKEPVESDQK